jgi:hypothetical protein
VSTAIMGPATRNLSERHVARLTSFLAMSATDNEELVASLTRFGEEHVKGF